MSEFAELLHSKNPKPAEVAAAVGQIADRLQRYEQYFDVIQANALRIELVDSVAALPANASPRQWFRVASGTLAERASVYVGNGPTLPLSKLTTSPL